MTPPNTGSPLPSRERALALTQEIRSHTADLMEAVVEAYTTRVWNVLGYSSWENYLTCEFGGPPITLPKKLRRNTVRELADRGLSRSAIALATGVSKSQAARDAGEPKPLVGLDGVLRKPPTRRQRPVVWNWVQVRFAVKPAEYEAIQGEARALGISEIDYVRQCFNTGRKLHAPESEPAV